MFAKSAIVVIGALKGLRTFNIQNNKIKKSDVSLLFITCTLTHLSSIRQFYGHKDDNFQMKECNNFHISAKNIDSQFLL